MSPTILATGDPNVARAAGCTVFSIQRLSAATIGQFMTRGGSTDDLVLAADAAQEHRRRRAAIMIAKRRERDDFRADGPERGNAFHQRGADLDWRPFRGGGAAASVDGVVPWPARGRLVRRQRP